jgi:hypothetical protein
MTYLRFLAAGILPVLKKMTFCVFSRLAEANRLSVLKFINKSSRLIEMRRFLLLLFSEMNVSWITYCPYYTS